MPEHSACVAETLSSGVKRLLLSVPLSRKPDKGSTSSKSLTKAKVAARWPRSRMAQVECSRKISPFHTVESVLAETPSAPRGVPPHNSVLVVSVNFPYGVRRFLRLLRNLDS